MIRTLPSKFIIGIAIVIFSLPTALRATQYYVAPTGVSINDGLTWAAPLDLQSALALATNGDQIWVQNGTYYPTATTDQNIAFTIPSNVQVYGGFLGNETALAQRPPALSGASTCILSGDIGTVGNSSDNTFHIIIFNNVANTTRLDGFTITGGANSGFAGGIYNNGSSAPSNSQPTISNCIFRDNSASYGGAAYNGGYGGYAKLTFLNCVFSNNTATNFGGAIYSDGQNSGVGLLELYDCILWNNNANYGGAILAHCDAVAVPNTILHNCTALNNTATGGGSLIYTWSGKTSIYNSILWNNVNTTALLANSSATVTATYSDIKNGYGGTGNINVNPQFININNPIGADGLWATADDGFRLYDCSPTANTGNNADVPATLTTDIAGDARIQNTTVNMGAYETTPVISASGTRLYVNAAAATSGNGASWTTALRTLAEATNLINACAYSAITEIWVANGTYYPTTTADRSISFTIPAGVSVYGGFIGNETSIAARPAASFAGGAAGTILSGDIGTANDNSDNSYNVVKFAFGTGNSHLDGCTVTNANNSVTYGGGIFNDGNATIQKCIIINNNANGNGGGVYNNNTLTILDALITNNTANDNGGGVYNNADMAVRNTIITNNTATNNGGGMYNNNNGATTFTDCLFNDNTAYAGGGAYNFNHNNSTVTGCTFANNTANYTGGAMYNSNASPVIINTIVWGNKVTSFYNPNIENTNGSTPNISYSDVQDNAGGTANISVNPFFIDAANPKGADGIWRTADDGLHLRGCSAAANTGSNADVPAGSATDLIGAARIQNTTVNMGAYETLTPFTPFAGTRFYVDAAATASGNGASWTTAFRTLAEALDKLNTDCAYTALTEIWVAKGTYYPTATTDQNISFTVPRGIKVYGGFAGTETAIAQRVSSNKTVLSGDIGTPNNTNDNTYVVVRFNNANSNNLLDGCTVRDGGGGISNNGEATISNCIVVNNTSTGIANTATAITNHAFIINTLIANNGGSGVSVSNYSNTADLTLTNCTIANNNGSTGSAIYNANSTLILRNTIAWGSFYTNGGTINSTYSNTQSGNAGVGNTTGNPGFVDVNNAVGADGIWGTADDGLRLFSCSAAANTGNNADVPSGITTDIAGAARIQNTTVNMGAYETITTVATFAGTRLYVNGAVAASGDGANWTAAFRTLPEALNTLTNGCAYANVSEVWVANGTYYPTATANRNLSFVVPSGVKLYGGFAGTETAIIQRANFGAAVGGTILSGNIGASNDEYDNSYTVVTLLNFAITTLLDGFVITDAHNDANGNGGGIYTTGAPVISNCIISNNYASGGGGGIYSKSTAAQTPTLINCIIANNNAYNGGGIYTDATNTPSITIINATITGNNVPAYGNSLYNNNAPATISNTIIWGNTGGYTPSPIYDDGNSTTVMYANVQGGVLSGSGNTSSTPSFANALNPKGADGLWRTADDGLRLLSCSLSANNGDNSLVPAGITTDVAGAARIQNTTVDRGAYETLTPVPSFTGTTLYVNAAAATSGNGTTWATAFRTIPEATNALTNGCAYSSFTDIWVANGVYYPTTTNDRSVSFTFPNGINVYGGFAGTETALTQRINFGASVLSGEIGLSGNTDNTYIIVQFAVSNTNNTLDGFTISGANNNNGGNGGGISNESSPVISNCIITNNIASNSGGGIFNLGSPRLINCIITDNTAGYQGGGIANAGYNATNLQIINCLLHHNAASYGGGGVYNNNSNGSGSVLIAGCTIVDNQGGSSGTGGGIGNNSQSSTVHNSIIYNNTPTNIQDNNATPPVYNSNIQGGTMAGSNGNIDVRPNFINPNNPKGADGVWRTADDGFHLWYCSLAADAGDNALVPTGIITDLVGALRIQNTTVNMGAYETVAPSPNYTGTTLYVNAAAAANGNGTTWATAFRTIPEALDALKVCVYTTFTTIWVQNGTYYPTATTDIFQTLDLPSGIKLYGGFAGNETTLAQRALPVRGGSSTCVISADIGVANNNADNSRLLISFVDATPATTLDGFTLNGTNTGKNISNTLQNATSSSPTITHCTISNGKGDYGAGIFNNSGSGTASPTITDCIFSNNEATDAGGALYNATNGGIIQLNLQRNTFTGNFASSNGAAISLDGANAAHTLTINDCVFTNNRIGIGSGGAIYTNEIPLTLTNTSFTHNTCYTCDGAALYIKTNLSNAATIDNCTFTADSTGANGRGGAIFATGNGANVTNTFTNCTFERNYAKNGGALGLYYTQSTAIATLSKAVFDGNASSVTGGAIYHASDMGSTTLNIDQSIFISNTTIDAGGAISTFVEPNTQAVRTNLNITNSLLLKNTATLGVNAINAPDALLSINNTTFFDNKGIDNNGDVRNSAYNTPLFSTGSSIKNSIFWYSNSIDYAYRPIEELSTTIAVEHCDIRNWGDPYSYVGIANINAEPSFIDATNPKGADGIWRTADDGFHLFACSIAANTGDNTAAVGTTDIIGAPRIQNTTVNMGAYETLSTYTPPSNIIYVNAAVAASGDGFTWATAYKTLAEALAIVAKCPFAGSQVWVQNGTYYPTATTDVDIAFVIPSGIKLYGGFVGNETSIAQRNLPAVGASGGTVLSGNIGALSDSTDNSKNIIIFNNVAATTVLDGCTVRDATRRGIINTIDVSTFITNNVNSKPTIRNCTVSHNQGGGMINNTYGLTFPRTGIFATVTNCLFANNYIAAIGGYILATSAIGAGVYNQRGGGLFTNCTFHNNHTYNDGQYKYDGGGVCNRTNGSTFTDCRFTYNKTYGDGGGVSNRTRYVTFNNCLFDHNSATLSGGGIVNFADEDDAQNGNTGNVGQPILNNCTFTNNTGGAYGGGFASIAYGAASASPTLTNCAFLNNAAPRGAGMSSYIQGGVYGLFNQFQVLNLADGSAVLNNCIFDSNTAMGAVSEGGAYYNFNTFVQTHAQLTNCVIINNKADNGSAIYNTTGSKDLGNDYLSLNNCTITNNTTNAAGKTIEVQKGAGNGDPVTRINNCIIYGNDGTSAFAVSDPAAAPEVNYSDIQGGYAGTNNIDAKPLFYDTTDPKGADGLWRTADDGLQLSCLSPALDAAANSITSPDAFLLQIPTTDLTGAANYNSTKDIGAYERQSTGCPAGIYTSGSPACQTLTINAVSGSKWFDIIGATGIVASINPNGMNLGTLTADIGDLTAVPTLNGVKYLPRTVNLSSTIAPAGGSKNGNYSLRLYYYDTELTDYAAAINSSTTLTPADFNMFWETGGSGCDIMAYSNTSTGVIDKALVSEAEYGIADNGFYLGFNLNHFTIFAATTVAANPLPVTWLSITASRQNKTDGVVHWSTASEKNARLFTLERSDDGANTFTGIAMLPAKNNTNGATYSYTDRKLSDGIHYYRIKQIDYDNQFGYSPIVSVVIGEERAYGIYPNPTEGIITIKADETNEAVTLTDAFGRILQQYPTIPTTIDLNQYAAGLYFVRIGNITTKVVKN